MNTLDNTTLAKLAQLDESLLKQIHLKLEVHLGEVELSLADLLELKAGSTLSTKQPVDTPVELKIEGKPIATGVLVSADGHFAIQISQMALK